MYRKQSIYTNRNKVLIIDGIKSNNGVALINFSGTNG